MRRALEARRVVKVAARDAPAQRPSSNTRETEVPSISKKSADFSLLEESGYGEKALLAAMAPGPGDGKRTPGSGGEGKGDGGGIIPPLPLVREKPPYPPLARRQGYEGKLVVRLLVSPTGRVDQVVLLRSSGYSILDRVAVKTLKKWRFRPAMKNGHPTSYWVEVPVVFDLKEARG